MTNKVIVHCPRCGMALDVPVEVERVTVEREGQRDSWAAVEFKDKAIKHPCRRKDSND